jgi:hypothetical protein
LTVLAQRIIKNASESLDFDCFLTVAKFGQVIVNGKISILWRRFQNFGASSRSL